METATQGTAPVAEGAAPGATPQADAATSTTAPEDRVKELQARLTAMGRERKAERDEMVAEIQNQRQAIIGQQQQLNYVQQNISAQQYQQWENHLATLSPADQALERSRMAEQTARAAYQRAQQNTSAPHPPTQPSRPAESDEDYSARLAQEIVDEANKRHGLSGEHALKVADMATDSWASERVFAIEAGVQAQQRAAKQEASVGDSETKLRERITQDVMKSLGVSGPLSAQPAGGGSEPPAEDIKRLADSSRTNRQGTSHSLKQLREQREALASRVSRE